MRCSLIDFLCASTRVLSVHPRTTQRTNVLLNVPVTPASSPRLSRRSLSPPTSPVQRRSPQLHQHRSPTLLAVLSPPKTRGLVHHPNSLVHPLTRLVGPRTSLVHLPTCPARPPTHRLARQVHLKTRAEPKTGEARRERRQSLSENSPSIRCSKAILTPLLSPSRYCTFSNSSASS